MDVVVEEPEVLVGLGQAADALVERSDHASDDAAVLFAVELPSLGRRPVYFMIDRSGFTDD